MKATDWPRNVTQLCKFISKRYTTLCPPQCQRDLSKTLIQKHQSLSYNLLYSIAHLNVLELFLESQHFFQIKHYVEH